MDIGLYSSSELQRLADTTNRSIGELKRRAEHVAFGWYRFEIHDSHARKVQAHAVRAVKNKLRLGCLSACSAHGIWTPPDREVHMLYHRKRRRPSPPHSSPIVQLHPTDRLGASAMSNIAESLEHVINYHSAETAMVVLESALNTRKISVDCVSGIIGRAPEHKARRLHKLQLTSQSGSETRVRHFLSSRKIRVRSQVYLPDIGRVDLLVGNSLIIECDSWEHHSQGVGYAKDRRRDAIAILRGYTVLRLSYWQIWHEWEQTQETILGVIRTRVHRRMPR